MPSNLNCCSCLRGLPLPLLLLLGLFPVFRPAGEGVELTNAVQVRHLAFIEAKESQPVRLQGVVTYCDPPTESLVIQDHTGGIFVRVPGSDPPLARGLLVSIEGVTEPGDYAPLVDSAGIRVLGQSALPEPRRVTVADLSSGRFDCLRVEVQAVVGAVIMVEGRPALHLHQGRDVLTARLRNAMPNDPELARLVDAEVRVRGIARVIAWPSGRTRRIDLLVPGLEEVTVEKRPPAAPFDIPVTRIADVSPTNTLHRIKLLAYFVSWETNRTVTVRDDSGQMSVRAMSRLTVEPGDLLEILGFPMEQRGSVYLDHGLARVIAPAFKSKAPLDFVTSDDTHQQLPLLQTIADVSHLSPEEAERGYPVRFRGIVTFYDAPWQMLFIHDATNGIFVWPGPEDLQLQPGQIVRVEGFSAAGDYVPTVIKARIVAQVQSELPVPRAVPYEVLSSGQEDSQWAALDGIVRAVREDGPHLVLDLAASGGRCDAVVSGHSTGLLATNLIDAEVRVQGVCSVIPNKRRQAIGFRLLLPSPAQIIVKEPAPSDPFALPVRTVDSLFRFGSVARPGHRVRVSGVVTMVRGAASFFLHDGTGGLQVERPQNQPVQPGDQVEVAGFPVLVGGAPHLQNAVLRTIGTGQAPDPRPVTLEEALSGQFNAELVTLQARLVEVMETAEQPALVLQAGDSLFDAILPFEATSAHARWRPGSLLQLTGIASTHLDDQGRPRSFQLLARSPAEILVLKRPPWWSLRHALLLASLLGVSILGALAWVGSLRQRVREQTAIIRERLEQKSRLESRYRELFENASDIVYTTDLEGRITSFNHAAELATGYTRSEAMGRNLADLIAPGHGGLLKTLVPVEGNGHAKRVHELEFVAKDGRRVPVEVDTQPLLENGRPVGLQGIARNIAERKRAEKAIHELNASLERRVGERTEELATANRELEAFSYSVSHDLRAPLRAINGFTEMLLRDHRDQLGPKGRHYLDNVAASGRKMGKLVDDLLAFSRLNRYSLTRERLDLTQLVRETAEDLRRQEPAHDVSFEIKPLPAARADRALVQQVLYNLLSNAWKFTAAKPNPRVEVGAQQNGDETVYYVKDNGAGFDMRYVDKLFGVFQRLHRDDEFPGTGVGLAIVQRIVSRHGGRVWAESRLKEEAIFYFTLPSESPKKAS